MTDAPGLKTLARERGTAYYIALCLLALAAILLLLMQRGFGLWALLPVLVGIAGGGTRFGPMLFALACAMTVNAPPPESADFARRAIIDVPDIILCAAVVGYAAGHYRLQAMLVGIFPRELRASSRKKRASWYRTPALVSRDEIAMLLVALPVFAVVGQVLWRRLAAGWGNPGLPPDTWTLVLAAWLVAVVAVTGSAFIGYWSWRQMTADEAALLLQDVLWNETRREQRRLNRWLTWAKTRRPAKEQS
jgi:hypothetical protein